MRGIHQYDSRHRLDTQDPNPHGRERTLGVLVSTPFHHHGLNATYVDLCYDTITISTATYGNSYPAGEVQHRAKAMTQSVIDDLNATIAELTAHRDRLTGELQTIDDRPWFTDLADQIAGAP